MRRFSTENPARAGPRLDDFADRIGQRGNVAHGLRQRGQATGIEAQPIEQGGESPACCPAARSWALAERMRATSVGSTSSAASCDSMAFFWAVGAVEGASGSLSGFGQTAGQRRELFSWRGCAIGIGVIGQRPAQE